MTKARHSLSNRVAIVTGAGKGLGRAYALHLAALGAGVVVNNRASNGGQSTRSADAVVSEIRAGGGEAIANYDSVEDSNAGQRLVSSALQHFGRLDIVVSNAGIDRASSFHKQQMADFETVLNINFLAVAHLLHAAWPHLRKARYGRIVVSTSSAGLYGNHGQAAYASSKAALLGLAKSLAIEGAPHNVLVNAIAPYAVTQLTEPWFQQEQVQAFSPESVSGLLGWLVSEHCNLKGTTLIVGANHARLVKTLETASIDLAEDPQAAVETLMQAPCGPRAAASASAEFEDFIRSLASARRR
jgi:NAD(P)-dependent dehydrogenase (short-subunit alcohol dehydrogenase family)